MQRAIGMVEFTSIARGIYVADQMVKISEVEIVTSVSTCPGKYITIVTGDVAAVQSSVALGEQLAEEFFVDSIVVPNVTGSYLVPVQRCRRYPYIITSVRVRLRISALIPPTRDLHADLTDPIMPPSSCCLCSSRNSSADMTIVSCISTALTPFLFSVATG